MTTVNADNACPLQQTEASLESRKTLYMCTTLLLPTGSTTYRHLFLSLENDQRKRNFSIMQIALLTTEPEFRFLAVKFFRPDSFLVSAVSLSLASFESVVLLVELGKYVNVSFAVQLKSCLV